MANNFLQRVEPPSLLPQARRGPRFVRGAWRCCENSGSTRAAAQTLPPGVGRLCRRGAGGGGRAAPSGARSACAAPRRLYTSAGGTAGRGRRAQKTRRRGRQMAHVRLRFLLDVKPKLRCGVRCSGETNQKNDQKTVPRKQNRKTNFRERSLAVDLRW